MEPVFIRCVVESHKEIPAPRLSRNFDGDVNKDQHGRPIYHDSTLHKIRLVHKFGNGIDHPLAFIELKCTDPETASSFELGQEVELQLTPLK